MRGGGGFHLCCRLGHRRPRPHLPEEGAPPVGLTLGLCRGKRMGDKREVIKRREAERQMRQDL